MKVRVLVLCALFSGVAYAEGFTPGDVSVFNDRLQEMINTTGWNFKTAINTRTVVDDWRNNQAGARLAYDSPRVYYGRVDKVLTDNMGVYLVIDQGTSYAVTMILDRFQPWPWKQVGYKIEIAGMQSSLQFAAHVKAGSTMYFQCRRVEFGLGVYANNCLAFPQLAAMIGAEPKAPKAADMSGDFEQLIKMQAAEGWARPASARKDMSVRLQISIRDDGKITSVVVSKTSGDQAYDQSAVNAVENIGTLPELQDLSSDARARYASFSMDFTTSDLTL